MIVLHVDMLVCRLVQWVEGIKVRLWVAGRVLAKDIPSSEKSSRHVIHTRLGDGAILHICAEVRAEVRCPLLSR